MRGKQRGVTFIGWVILLIPVAIVGYVVIRTVPVYLNYMKVSKALTQLAKETVDDDAPNVVMLRNSLQKQFDIDNVDFPPVDSVAITRNGKSWTARAKYEDEVPLFTDISLLLKFDKSVVLK